MIWGTDVNVVESMERFRQFLLEFTLEGEDEPLYKSQLEEIHRTQARLTWTEEGEYLRIVVLLPAAFDCVLRCSTNANVVSSLGVVAVVECTSIVRAKHVLNRSPPMADWCLFAYVSLLAWCSLVMCALTTSSLTIEFLGCQRAPTARDFPHRPQAAMISVHKRTRSLPSPRPFSPLVAPPFPSFRATQEFNISINCKHLYSFVPSRRLYQQLVHYPQVAEQILPTLFCCCRETLHHHSSVVSYRHACTNIMQESQ